MLRYSPASAFSTCARSSSSSAQPAAALFARTWSGDVAPAITDATGRRRGFRLPKLLDREVRAADLAHLPDAHQIVQRAEGLGDRRVGVGLVQLVQVDAVGSQAAEAVLGRAAHILGLGALPLLVHRHPALGRNQDG